MTDDGTAECFGTRSGLSIGGRSMAASHAGTMERRRLERGLKALQKHPPLDMAHLSSIGMAFAMPTASVDIPKARDLADSRSGLVAWEKKASALLTPPSSISPDLPPNHAHPGLRAPPSMTGDKEMDLSERQEQSEGHDLADTDPTKASSMPLSRGALSGLDAAAAITPAMLAKHHLPAIMLGNGPKPIRYVMGELTQSVPGFSRIPPAKARRLVVAALESRHGGGPDGNVTFCKTGWGRWDAHIKGTVRDSAVGSFNEGHFSPPRSEHGSYAFSHADSGMQMHGTRMSAHRDHHSGGSWTASSLREEDELDMDMDVPENEADKMSLDGRSMDEDSESLNDDTDEEDWSAVGADALRKASLPTPGMPRKNYNALSASYKQRGERRNCGTFEHGLNVSRGSPAFCFLFGYLLPRRADGRSDQYRYPRLFSHSLVHERHWAPVFASQVLTEDPGLTWVANTPLEPHTASHHEDNYTNPGPSSEAHLTNFFCHTKPRNRVTH
nr:protein stb3 [Quercus suber]